jgi:hypothetical protein
MGAGPISTAGTVPLVAGTAAEEAEDAVAAIWGTPFAVALLDEAWIE